MNTLTDFTKVNEYNKRCADAIKTLKLFVKDAEQQHETRIQISTIKLIFGSIEEGV